jgi:hypothetical protein
LRALLDDKMKENIFKVFKENYNQGKTLKLIETKEKEAEVNYY